MSLESKEGFVEKIFPSANQHKGIPRGSCVNNLENIYKKNSDRGVFNQAGTILTKVCRNGYPDFVVVFL